MELQQYRDRQLRNLTSAIGVYALCDLDEIPIYVGQSMDGIRTRVRRHLTSARSDVIANRQLDVWEIAYVWAWPMAGALRDQVNGVEQHLTHEYHSQHPLMNGIFLPKPSHNVIVPDRQMVRVLPEEEIERRKDPTLRLPRQAAQFNNLFSWILEVKNNEELRRTLEAHFDRLQRYYLDFMARYES